MVEESNIKQSSLDFSDIDLARQLFGEHNSNLQRIAEATDVTINARGNTVFIAGDKISSNLAENILNQLYGLLKEGYPVHPNDIDFAVSGNYDGTPSTSGDAVPLTGNGLSVDFQIKNRFSPVQVRSSFVYDSAQSRSRFHRIVKNRNRWS